MLDHLISANQTVKDLIYKHLDDRDIDFIKELIMGEHLETYSSFTVQSSSVSAESKWTYRGRNKDKSFLYKVGIIK